MKLEMIMDYDLTWKLLKNISSEITPFATREGIEYRGWTVEQIDCNGAEPALCDENGQVGYFSHTDIASGIRPSTSYSKIKDYCKVIRTIKEGCLEVEFGEYPQYLADQEVQERLNKALLEGTLNKTGKTFTLYNEDEVNPDVYDVEEVIDNGNKYVCKNNNWYQISPLKWIVDEKANIALSKNIISGGIPYGGYKEPPMTEWEKEFERKCPMKLPESVRRAHRLRKIDPTIIEGFLIVVLSKDILPEELAKKEEFVNKEIEEIKLAEKAREQRYQMLEDCRLPLFLNDEWLRRNMNSSTYLPTKLQYEDFCDRLANPEPTKSERLLSKLVDSLSDEEIKREAEEKGLNQEEAKVYVKRKVELRDTLKGYKK